MSAAVIVANGVSWAIQTLLIVGAAGCTLAVLRVTNPALRLRTWHTALALCLVLPLVGPWQTVASEFAVPPASGRLSVIPWRLWAAAIVVTGIAARVVWLCVGMGKLRGLRRRSTPWSPEWFANLARAVGVSAAIRVSREIRSAVTFGWRHASILVPDRLVRAPETHQRAVAAHELRHVARRDWLWVLAEEAVRTVFWWHPAIWFAIAEARLAREELVDREAIAITRNRAGYLEALVAAAEPSGAVVGGFVPHFYRRRQFSARIRRLLKENDMSPRRMFACMVMIALALPATAWAAASAFPLVSDSSAAVGQDPPPPPPPPPPATSKVQAPPPPPSAAPAAPPRVVRKEIKRVDPQAGEQKLPPPPPPPAKPAPRKVVKVSEGVPGGLPGGIPAGVPPPPPRPVKKATKGESTLMPPPPPPPPAPPKTARPVKKGGGDPPPPPPPPAPPKVIKK